MTTPQVQARKLATVSVGQRILSPSGLTYPVAGLRWRDPEGQIVVIEWSTGNRVEAAGQQVVHAIDGRYARTVTQHRLSLAPRPIWTSDFPEELVRQAWSAHLDAQLIDVLEILAPLRRQQFTRRPDSWASVAMGLALYAFTADITGKHPVAVAVARELAANQQTWNPGSQRPAVIRHRLAQPLPTTQQARMQETLQRWALAIAYRLPATGHQRQHMRDLNRLRAARAEELERVPGRRVLTVDTSRRRMTVRAGQVEPVLSVGWDSDLRTKVDR